LFLKKFQQLLFIIKIVYIENIHQDKSNILYTNIYIYILIKKYNQIDYMNIAHNKIISFILRYIKAFVNKKIYIKESLT
jgi:hypothetical protein